MLSVHIGHSRLPDSGEAAVDAIDSAKKVWALRRAALVSSFFPAIMTLRRL